MIDFDTSVMPTGTLGWTRLLEAVYNADPNDENEWIEFKAGLDPRTKPGRGDLAKAIVAFANRDPDRAAQWLEGYALIVLGLEPGNACGAHSIDPAQLHDALEPLLTSPAPAWDVTNVTYRDVSVLIVSVAPARPGDPIHAIAKNTGDLRDGTVFVRQVGKSAPASSAELQRLSARMVAGQQPALALRVDLAVEGGLTRCEWSDDDFTGWLERERRRLMEPLERELEPDVEESPLRLDFEIMRQAHEMRSLWEKMHRLSAAAGSFGSTEIAEDRDPDDYRKAVGAYLNGCREALSEQEARERIAAGTLPVGTWSVTNLGQHNLHDVQVRVHVEGDVEAFAARDTVRLRALFPKPPRIWGPRTKPSILDGLGAIRTPSIPYTTQVIQQYSGPRGPIVDNGGSVNIQFDEIHLRARATEVLDDTYVLVVAASHPGPVRYTWTATATNVSDVAEGANDAPLNDDPVDLWKLALSLSEE